MCRVIGNFGLAIHSHGSIVAFDHSVAILTCEMIDKPRFVMRMLFRTLKWQKREDVTALALNRESEEDHHFASPSSGGWSEEMVWYR